MDIASRSLQFATSKPAQRTYIHTLLFTLSSAVLFALAFVAYGLFYAIYIPQINVERVVHLQFGHGNPFGVALLNNALVSNQAYDVLIHMDLPRSPPNLAAGNFMLDLSLLSFATPSERVPNDRNVIMRSRRSALLTYTSPLLDYALTSARFPWFLLGWKRESEQLHVPMMEKVVFSRGARNSPSSLRLEIEADEKLMVYSARVEFAARFRGLRWFMYNHRILSLLLFTSVFYFTSLLSAAAAWLGFSNVISPRSRTGKTTSLGGLDNDTSDGLLTESKDDLDDLDLPDLSDTPRTFPTSSRQPPLRYPLSPRATPDVDGEASTRSSREIHTPAGDTDSEDERLDLGRGGGRTDSGIGTSLDESSGRTMRRRRDIRDGRSSRI